MSGVPQELARARALLVAGRPEDALRELATLPPEQANSRPGFVLRAAALAAVQRWQESAEVAESGLATNGPDPGLLGLLGGARRELGDLPAAERALLDGLALAPHETELLCRYAGVCMDAGQLEKAAQLVERAAEQDPEDELVYATRVRMAYAQGKDRQAQRLSQEFLAAHPEDPVAHALLGSTSAARGQVSPAYAGLRQAAGAVPANRELAEAALEGRIASHPLLLPIRPVARIGPVKVWLAAVAVLVGGGALGLPAPVMLVLAGTWVGFVVYSWVVPPLVGWWLRRRWR